MKGVKMKKKILFVLAIATVLCLLAISVFAADVDGVYYSLDAKNQVATVNKDNRTATTEIVVIPSTIEYEGVTYKVTKIDNDAFSGNKNVKELKILSEYITAIPASMIINTYDGALEKIYIDFSRITTIGSAGFNPSYQSNGNNPVANKFYYYDAKAYLETGEDVKITEPDFSNCTSIGFAAFQGANFEKITIPAAVYLKGQMFRMCTMKELVVEGEDRTHIELYAFQACKQLEKITIKSRNLKNISNDVFSDDTAVKEIYIDMSKCEFVNGSAFLFAPQYDSGQTRVQWYNLEGEKVVDLSSMKTFKTKSFSSSNIGSAKIIWPKAIEVLEDQTFRKCNINQPILISAAQGVTLSLPYYAFDGNAPTLFMCNEGVVSFAVKFSNTTAVLLAPSINITQGDGAFVGGSTLYCKGFADGSKIPSDSNCTKIMITSGTISNYGVCGIVADVEYEGGTATVGDVVHDTNSGIDDALCPIGKVLVTTCKYCDYVAYSVDGEAVEKKEHSYVLVGSITYTDYFQMGYKTNKCECGAEKSADEATEMALFIDYGYSATEEAINGKYSMVQVYGINDTAYKAYVEAGNTLEYGLVVSVVNNPLDESQSDLIATNKTYIAKQSFIAHDYFEIGIVGIGEGQTDVRLTFCAYVIDNGEVFYLDGGKTLTEATQKCYDDIKIQTER